MKVISNNGYSITSMFASIYLIYGIGASTSWYANLLLFFLGFLWLIIAAIVDAGRLINAFFSLPTVFYCIFLSFFCLSILVKANFSLGIKYLGMFILYLIINLMYKYYCDLNNNIYMKFIMRLSFIGFMFFVIKGIFFYLFNPGAARILAGNPEYYGNVLIGGGYQLAYLACIMCCYLMLRLNVKNILVCIILSILLIKTQSTITIIIAILGMTLSLICVILKKFKLSDRIVIGIFAVLFLISIFILRANIGELIVLLSENGNSTIMIRLQEVGKLLQGEHLGNESATMLRMAVYKDSLEVIAAHPLFGELLTYGAIPGFGNTGGHSDMLDAIARWGIIMGSFFLLPFFIAINRTKKMLESGWGYTIACLILMLLNPCIGFSFSAGIFFLIPSMEKIKKEK